jgi:hypothetical protein
MRPTWSCAKQKLCSECRQAFWSQGKSEELPWVLRSRMAMSAASIADAQRTSRKILGRPRSWLL